MLNLGASKPRVKVGARAPRAPPRSAPGTSVILFIGVPRVNTSHDAIGQSEVTWPPIEIPTNIILIVYLEHL